MEKLSGVPARVERKTNAEGHVQTLRRAGEPHAAGQMRDEPEPPRKTYQLKPREFERVNDHPGHAAPDSDPAVRPARIDVRDHFQSAAAMTPPPPAGAPRAKSAANDVHAILRDNLARADAAGLNDFAPPSRKRSRRKRDYWLLLLTVNALFAFVAFGPYSNPMTQLYALAGFIMFSLGLTWVMWFVFDDY